MIPEEPQEVLTVGADRRSTRGRILLALLVAGVLALSGYQWLTDEQPAADAQPPTQQELAPRGPSAEDDDSRSDRSAGAGDARLAYAVGRTLHISGETVMVRTRGPGADTVVRLRGQVASGWLASLVSPAGGQRSHGVVDDSGRFTPLRRVQTLVGTQLAFTSPDGGEVLAVVGGRTRIVDTSSGAVVGTLPPGRAAAWTGDGVYLFQGSTRGTARVWDPDEGPGRLRFNARRCRGDLAAITASIEAGWKRCRDAHVVAVSPSGDRFLRRTGSQQWPAVVTQDGDPLGLRLHGDSDEAPSQRLKGAAYLGENEVVLNLAEQTGDGLVSAFVQCTLTDGVCTRVSEVIAAKRSPGAAFVVVHECHDGDRGGFAPISRLTGERVIRYAAV